MEQASYNLWWSTPNWTGDLWLHSSSFQGPELNVDAVKFRLIDYYVHTCSVQNHVKTPWECEAEKQHSFHHWRYFAPLVMWLREILCSLTSWWWCFREEFCPKGARLCLCRWCPNGCHRRCSWRSCPVCLCASQVLLGLFTATALSSSGIVGG